MDLPPAIYAEAEVPGYSLPALAERNEMLGALERIEYGQVPPIEVERSHKLIKSGMLAGTDDVMLEQWRVTLSTSHASREFVMALFLPAASSAEAKIPVFLGLNFYGNHTVHADPAILLTEAWCRDEESMGVKDNRATEAGRGARSGRWPVEMITERGYGLAQIYYGELAPDHAEHWRDGLAELWADEECGNPAGAIATWAWGLSRAGDVLTEIPRVDAGRIAVIGHSRLGKAALWAGAKDDAFAIVVSNESGCGGAALSRRRIGERLIHINTRFPHWFTPAFGDFDEREGELPVDQHQLLAAVAPRALYVASAEDDRWADPRGEYLALAAAAEAWRDELSPEPPAVGDARIQGMLAYHCRAGEHDLRPEDWERFLTFADLVWRTAM